MNMEPEAALLTVAETADQLGWSESTVRRAFDSGMLTGTVTPGGHRRISPASVAAASGSTPPQPKEAA